LRERSIPVVVSDVKRRGGMFGILLGVRGKEIFFGGKERMEYEE